MRIVYEHLHVHPTPPSELNPRISRAIDAVILRCLEKDPAQRYATVSDVYEALSDAIGTPSVSLDADEVAVVRQAGPAVAPEAERVPTGVGGMSRVIPGDFDDELDEFVDDLGEDKPKRDKSKRGDWADDFDWSDEMTEKQAEKQREGEEKADEKQTEKGWDPGVEKGEMAIDFGPSDRLSQFTFGGWILWIGIVFLLGFSSAWAWIIGGLGGLMLVESAVRLVVPEFRARPGGRLVIGSVLLTVGLGMALGFANWWAVVLIAIGVSLLINRLFD